MRACVVNRCAHVRACGVYRRACVCAYGWKNYALEARLRGRKRVFLMFLIGHVVDLGGFFVVKVSCVHDVDWLVREGLVPAVRRRGYLGARRTCDFGSMWAA
jgi:hypothetical protein